MELMMDIRRRVMEIMAAGGSITKETVEFTVSASSYNHNIEVAGDVNKILFCHYYDKDATYPTNGTTYEGHRIGPALAHVSEASANTQWHCFRTNAAGNTTGWNNYGSNAVFSDGHVNIAANPQLTVGHKIVLEVFYDA